MEPEQTPKTSEHTPKILANKPDIQELKLSQVVKHFDPESIRVAIGKTISLILRDIGIKIYPDKYLQKRIIHYLVEYYQDCSLSEVKTAFELAIIGSIKVNTEHYQNFDIPYLTRILNAYREYRAFNNAQMSAPLPPSNQQKNIHYSEVQYFKRLSEVFNLLSAGKKVFFIPVLAYNRLIEYEIMQVSDHDWLEMMQASEPQYIEQLKQRNNLESRYILKNFEYLKHQYPLERANIQRIAKKIAVYRFFRQLQETGTSLETLIKQSGIYDEQERD